MHVGALPRLKAEDPGAKIFRTEEVNFCRLCLDGLVSLIIETDKIHWNPPFFYSF